MKTTKNNQKITENRKMNGFNNGINTLDGVGGKKNKLFAKKLKIHYTSRRTTEQLTVEEMKNMFPGYVRHETDKSRDEGSGRNYVDYTIYYYE